MDNRQSFSAVLRDCIFPRSGASADRVNLSGRRYEHIHVRLAEAIHGFRYSRKGLPGQHPELWRGICVVTRPVFKPGVHVWVGFPKISKARDGLREAHMDVLV